MPIGSAAFERWDEFKVIKRREYRESASSTLIWPQGKATEPFPPWGSNKPDCCPILINLNFSSGRWEMTAEIIGDPGENALAQSISEYKSHGFSSSPVCSTEIRGGAFLLSGDLSKGSCSLGFSFKEKSRLVGVNSMWGFSASLRVTWGWGWLWKNKKSDYEVIWQRGVLRAGTQSVHFNGPAQTCIHTQSNKPRKKKLYWARTLRRLWINTP